MEADLIIKNVRVFNAYLKRFLHTEAVAVLNGRFLHVGSLDGENLTAKEILDGKGRRMIPGLIDIHMHVESSMTTPQKFSEAVISYGVTTVVADPHEIANVFGIEGIREFIKNSEGAKLDIFFGIPSSVPSTLPLLETTGGAIGANDVSTLLENERVICLGEVMNFKELIGDAPSEIKEIIKTIKSKKSNMPIEGHCPKIEGLDLSRYIYSGVDADHTQQSVKSIEEKIRNGMFLEIQEKSMTPENLRFLEENALFEHFCFVTDDTMADKLVKGQLNKLVEKAIEMGMSLEMAIYCSTYTPACRMGLKDRGAIAPGKLADFVLLDEDTSFGISAVFKNGKEIKGSGRASSVEKPAFPEHFYKSIKLNTLTESDFEPEVPSSLNEVTCRVMVVSPTTTFTEEVEVTLPVRHGKLCWEESDCCLLGVFERYGKTGEKAFGLVRGSVIKEGAVATSWAHDHHNLMVMGKNTADMTVAANFVIKNQGGYCAVKDGKVLAAVELPVGGIVSEEKLEVLAEKLGKLRNAMKELGYNHHNEIMSFSTLSLPVSPSLKITDKGLIRVKTQEIVPLIVH